MSPPAKGLVDTRSGRVDRSLPRAVVPVVVAALALGLSGWWFTHPGVFDQGGSLIGASVDVGEVVHVGTGVLTGDAVRLSSVRPVLAEGSVAADIDVRVCTDGAVGAIQGSLEELCGDVQRVAGAVLDGYGSTVVVSIRPRSPGVLVIEGFDVTYRQGVRYGRDRTGVRVEITTVGGP